MQDSKYQRLRLDTRKLSMMSFRPDMDIKTVGAASCKWFDFDCQAKTVLGLVWFSFDFHYQAKAVLGLSPKLRLCEISCLQLQHAFRVAMNKV